MRTAVSYGIKCIGFLLLWGLLAVAAIPLSETAAFLTGSGAYAQLCRNGTALAAAGVVAFLISKTFLPEQSLRRQMGARPGDGLWMGAGFGVFWAAGTLLAFRLSGGLHFIRQEMAVQDLGVWIAALACGVLTQGILAHGLFYPAMEGQFSRNAALVGSAVLFAALHFPQWKYGPAAFLGLLAMGLVLSLLRRYSGGILAPAAAHFVWDFAAGILFGGFPFDPYPSVIQISLNGPAWLSGGQAGMMGSLLTMAVTLGAAALLALYVSRKKRKKA